MSTIVEEPPREVLLEADEQGPDVSVLTDKVPVHLRAPSSLAAMVLVLGLVYLFFCTRPIWHTDVWGHLSYGRYLWETGALPATEPLLPFAKGMPFVDSAWLSQLIGYAIVSTGRLQLAGLQGLFAILVTACATLLTCQSYRQNRHVWFAFLSVGVFLLVSWIPLSVPRPQLAGQVCFVFLLTRLASGTRRASDWIVIPIVFALWANLHASFMMGLGLLASFWMGRSLDVFRRTRSVLAVMRDQRTRRLLLLTELAATAVLLNPYTIGLYVEALQFSKNANLQDLTEWHPLTLRDSQGQVFALVAVLLAVLYRLSPRRVQSWEVLALIGLGAATMWSNRMIVWWGPVAGLLTAQHAFAAWRRWRHAPLVAEPAPRAGKWSVVSVGLAWIFLMLSPLGIALLHGKHTPVARALSKSTPIFAVEYLTKHPPQGPVFNTYEWGDYLQWAGPKDLQLFVNSHAHLIPRDVWQAYMQVIELRTGWEEVLDRYGVNTVVVDSENRESLIKRLKEDEKWQFPPEERDGQVIFIRKKPIQSGTPKPNMDGAGNVNPATESH